MPGRGGFDDARAVHRKPLMQFAETTEGQHWIFVGALDAPGGDGFVAALVVKAESAGRHRVVYRDDCVACGYRWPTAHEAITYALARGREVARRRSRETPRS